MGIRFARGGVTGWSCRTGLAVLLLVAWVLMVPLPVDATGGTEMDKGIVFFAPDPSTKWHPQLSADPQVSSSEVFLMWSEIETAEGVYNWSKIDTQRDRYAALGKKITFRVSTAAFSPNDSPAWLYNTYHVRRITYGPFLSFEKGLVGYEVLAGGHTTTAAAEVLSGSTSLVGTGGDFLSSGTNALSASYGVSVGFDFKVLSTGRFTVSWKKTDGSSVVLEEWTATAGTRAARTFDVLPATVASGGTLVFSAPEGSLSVDNVQISSNKAGFHVGNLCFPNYFDPVFKEKFGNFIQALSAKYKNDPAIAAVCVGGFGRWEELTLCGDGDPQGLAEQWTTYAGTSDRMVFSDKYLDHVRWVVDAFVAAFRPAGKPLYMCAIGYPGSDAFRDQNYIDWKSTNYLAKNGIGIKYNGWQSMASEWGSPDTAIFYQNARYKNDPDVPIYYEEGAQVDSTLSEVMGHPLSMFNRAILDGIDALWMYDNDIRDPFVRRYLHYADEQAGSALITRFYNLLGAKAYKASTSGASYTLYDQWMGLYQMRAVVNGVTATNGVYRVKYDTDFVTLDGVTAARTNSNMRTIRFSLDDRQRYEGLYGAVVSVDYLDSGTDLLKVSVANDSGSSTVGQVKKTGTGLWKTASFAIGEKLTGRRNGGVDAGDELSVYDNGDGIETVSAVWIDAVPARQWSEDAITSRSIVSKTGTELGSTATVFEVSQPSSRPLSGIAVALTPIGTGYVNANLKVYAVTGSGNVLLTDKDYFMPEDADRVYLPVANAPASTLRFRVEAKRTQGRVALATASDGKPAYWTTSFRPATPDLAEGGAFSSSTALVVPGTAFSALDVVASGKVVGTLRRLLPGGGTADVASFTFDAATAPAGSASGSHRAFFTPQPAGRYQVVLTSGTATSVAPVPLDRLMEPNAPHRYLLGSAVLPSYASAASASGFWKPVSGFVEATVDSNGFKARVAARGPTLETTSGLSYSAASSQSLHFVLSNGTASGLVKVYWKTSTAGWSELRSVMVPVVPNDAVYREYSWAIGTESTYSGTITGLRFVAATGPTETGRVGIRTIEIRSDATRMSGYHQAFSTSSAAVSNFGLASGGATSTPAPTSGTTPGATVTPDPQATPEPTLPPGVTPTLTPDATPTSPADATSTPNPDVTPGTPTPKPTGGPAPNGTPLLPLLAIATAGAALLTGGAVYAVTVRSRRKKRDLK